MAINISVKGIDNLVNNLQQKVSSDKISQGIAKGCEIVKAEAKAKCPVSTEKTRPGGPHGELRASITSEVNGNMGIVGTNKKYGVYVELGTCKMEAQPFLIPALEEKREEVIQAVKAACK